MWIKVLLVAGLIVFALVGLAGRQRAGRKALRRLAIVLFGLGALVAVLDPDAITWVANKVGVGRGTDLVLYVLVLAFLFALIGFSARFSDQEDRLVDLARSVALNEAVRDYPEDVRDDARPDDAAPDVPRTPPAPGDRPA